MTRHPGGRFGIPALTLLVAVSMLAVGLALGEFQSVFANAVTVCLSCIGIG